MERELFINNIKKHCFFLEDEGFTFNQIERNIFYTKKTKDEGFSISFSWLEYDDNFQILGLKCLKRFNNIEQELQKVLGGNLDDYYTIYKTPTIERISEELKYNIIDNNTRYILKIQNDILLFTNFIKEFYFKNVLSFYENYLKLISIDSQLIELLKLKKIQSILTSNDNSTIIRFYVIACFSNNLKVLNFFNKTYFPYLNENLDNEIYKIELERLEKIKYNIQHTL